MKISLLSDIKFFLKKYLKNPAIISAVAYIIYNILTQYMKKEGYAESISVLKQSDKYNLIYDTKLNKYILIADKIYSSESEEDMKQFIKKKYNEVI